MRTIDEINILIDRAIARGDKKTLDFLARELDRILKAIEGEGVA